MSEKDLEKKLERAIKHLQFKVSHAQILLNETRERIEQDRLDEEMERKGRFAFDAQDDWRAE